MDKSRKSMSVVDRRLCVEGGGILWEFFQTRNATVCAEDDLQHLQQT